MGDITVDPKGVAKLLDGQDVHKAPGQDGPNVRVLKECSNGISPILTVIFNESLARGDVPDKLRQANVLLYVKNSIPIVDIEQNRSIEESTWFKINLSDVDLVTCWERTDLLALVCGV